MPEESETTGLDDGLKWWHKIKVYNAESTPKIIAFLAYRIKLMLLIYT